jgi:hypothetical protein
MIGRPIIKSKLISVKVPDNVTAQTQIRFPQDNEVDGRVCLGFAVYNAAIISVCPNGQATVANLQPIAVTLKNPQSVRFVDNYPAFAADPINVFGLFVAVQPFIISMQESQIQYFNNEPTLSNSLAVNIFYCEVAEFQKLSKKLGGLDFMLR